MPTYNPDGADPVDDFIDDIPPETPPKATLGRKTTALEEWAKSRKPINLAAAEPPAPRPATLPGTDAGVLSRPTDGPSAPQPPLTHIPSYGEAVALVGAIRKVRDDLNRQLVKFYNFQEVRKLPLAEQIDLLQRLALEYSSTAYVSTKEVF